MAATHLIFVKFLDDLSNAIHKAPRSPHHRILDTIDELDRRRREGRQERLSRFEQARIYSEGNFANRAGIIKTVPKPLVEAVRRMMEAYTEYFGGTHYEHEAERAMIAIKDALSPESTSEHLTLTEDHRYKATSAIHFAHMHLELRWMIFSREYYRTYAIFADYGVFVGRDKFELHT